MLHEEVEKYIKLSGDKEAWQTTPIIRIGGYLDGYDRGLEVLEKISAEIEELYSYADFDEDTETSYNMVRLEEVQRVIDKYKGERESDG